ncbi:hypothetical protein HOD05_01090 [Candidatus Woesearchaeota archaeon]|jgi:hypothetical protein|nr:hypothetical protein [Candidatus Woesearchaeota archaeon]MBT4151002.1 hypothetical protein [Candidatus Woesearchaeota archaeon]MBT4247229.1 hypothetical protein [Candidatus Woesearchaeota archaeon]MBT4433792.1 hypothetical protein [Candidatus Woesearchaeota archaeon]MBT7332209.1 hypothetical protein [Candidatus Woesearchaeota archaeon]
MGAITSCCVECDQPITNPICASCLSEEMHILVHETRPDLAKHIVGFHFGGEVNCIKCQKGMSLCAHCFSKDIYEYIKENDSMLAKEFVNRFDFDLRVDLISDAF